MSKSSILFIVNPISGGKNKLRIPGLIDTYLDQAKYDFEYKVTEYVGHAAEIADSYCGNYDLVVAVGGDGTINEVASTLVGRDKAFGIIPVGSGNGLARFLNIPMNTVEAINVINNGYVKKIDTASLNGKRFFNMAGMGFDAHISSIFAGDKSRGLTGYVKLGLREILKYKPRNYQIVIDGQHYVREAVMISIANSSQYGNNVHIAPEASITDGLLDVCIVKDLSLYKLPLLAYQMLIPTTSNLVEVLKGRRISISRSEDASIHIDGEPYVMGKQLDIEVNPLSLNIITPQS